MNVKLKLDNLIAGHKTNRTKWNIMPLLGDFGGRVGIYSFFRALLSLECSLLSLFVTIFFIFSLQVCACMLAGGDETRSGYVQYIPVISSHFTY